MKWLDVLEDTSLQDLSYKIELNEWGQIVMSPASNSHGRFQGKIATGFNNQLGYGETITECSIETEKGVKVADVAWCSDDFIKKHGLETPFTEAPEICVEIIPPSNHPKEIEEKKQLYLDQGAKEVWLVSEDGETRFYNSSGPIDKSQYSVQIHL